MANPYSGPPRDQPNPYQPPANQPPPYGAPPPAAGYPQGGYPPPGGPVAQPGNLVDRFVARFIDGVILGIVSTIISVVLSAISPSWILTGLVDAVIVAALYLGYFSYLESTRGQTLGKQVMKLKVVGPDQVSNPTMEQAVRRNIWTAFGIAGVIPILGSILGALAALVAVILIVVGINSDPRRQHWFDKFAGGTQVYKVG